jgi:hypothetical protein
MEFSRARERERRITNHDARSDLTIRKAISCIREGRERGRIIIKFGEIFWQRRESNLESSH